MSLLEKHLEAYRHKECEMPTYDELMEYERQHQKELERLKIKSQ